MSQSAQRNAMDPAARPRVEENPGFSILIPVYNHEKFIGQALDTCLAQNYPHWEALVVDDGSTDNTPALLKKYAALDPRIRIFSKPNGGTSSALNEALTHAKNPWCCWLSSDDMFEPDKLEVHAQAIREQPQILFFHSNYYELHQKDGIKRAPQMEHYKALPPPDFQVLEFFKWNFVHGNSIAIHRSVFDSVGPFNTIYRNGQDHDMWLRMSAATPFHFINRRTCITRIHEGQGTALGPDYGLLDSARSCLEFTNSHTFEEHFPFTDLSNPNEALEAVRRTLQIASTISAFMYQGLGFVPFILDRMLEWLYQPGNLQFLNQLLPSLVEVNNEMARSGMPDEMKAAFSRLVEKREMFIYQPYDGIAAMEASLRKMEQAQSLKDAQVLRGYLERIRSLGTA